MQFLFKIEAALDWPTDVIIRHFERRLFELAMAVIMIGVGLLLFISPRSIEASSMRYLLDVMSVATYSTLLFLFGLLRIIALALNGHWMPGGAYCRAGGAAIGAIMWSQWGAALFQLHLHGTPVSPGVIVYGGLTFFEVISFARALRGAVSSGQADRQSLGHDQQVARHSGSGLGRVHRGGGSAAAVHHQAVPVRNQA